MIALHSWSPNYINASFVKVFHKPDVKFALISNILGLPSPLSPGQVAYPFFLMIEFNDTRNFHAGHGDFATQELEFALGQMQYQPSIGSQMQARLSPSTELLSCGGFDNFASQNPLGQWPQVLDSSSDEFFQEPLSNSKGEYIFGTQKVCLLFSHCIPHVLY